MQFSIPIWDLGQHRKQQLTINNTLLNLGIQRNQNNNNQEIKQELDAII
jgi:hypothetical protein